MLSIQKLTKRFAGRAVLDAVDLEVPRGNSVGIIGPGGCGKTVLLKLVAGLLSADSGSINVDGHELVGASEADLDRARAGMGMLFQNYALFDSLSVADNVAFPLLRGQPITPEVGERVAEKLEQVGLAGAQKLFARELSGGMKKRVGLARALVAKPALLLLDEPSAGLDPVNTRVVNDLLNDLRKSEGYTAVVAAYDFDTIRDVIDTVVLIHQGHIIYSGTPDEVASTTDRHVRHLVDGSPLPA